MLPALAMLLRVAMLLLLAMLLHIAIVGVVALPAPVVRIAAVRRVGPPAPGVVALQGRRGGAREWGQEGWGGLSEACAGQWRAQLAARALPCLAARPLLTCQPQKPLDSSESQREKCTHCRGRGGEGRRGGGGQSV
jgi:hypothetical protein